MAHPSVHCKHSPCPPLGNVAQYKGFVAAPGPSAVRHTSLVVAVIEKGPPSALVCKSLCTRPRLSASSVTAVSGRGSARPRSWRTLPPQPPLPQPKREARKSLQPAFWTRVGSVIRGVFRRRRPWTSGKYRGTVHLAPAVARISEPSSGDAALH